MYVGIIGCVRIIIVISNGSLWLMDVCHIMFHSIIILCNYCHKPLIGDISMLTHTQVSIFKGFNFNWRNSRRWDNSNQNFIMLQNTFNTHTLLLAFRFTIRIIITIIVATLNL